MRSGHETRGVVVEKGGGLFCESLMMAVTLESHKLGIAGEDAPIATAFI